MPTSNAPQNPKPAQPPQIPDDILRRMLSTPPHPKQAPKPAK